MDKNKPITLITGASAGIGKATAIALSELGYPLILIARRAEQLAELKESILARHPALPIHVIALDICDTHKMTEALEQLPETFRSVQILINNAGMAKGVDKVSDSNWDDWSQMIDTNVKGLFAITHQLIPTLLKQPDAHIINIGSIAGIEVYPGGAVYCASKHAVHAFTKGLKLDLTGTNVRVSEIMPGMVETEFSIHRLQGDHEKAKNVYKGMTPLRAEDIADLITFTLTRPKHVNISSLLVLPTDQSSTQVVHRE